MSRKKIKNFGSRENQISMRKLPASVILKAMMFYELGVCLMFQHFERRSSNTIQAISITFYISI